MHGRKLLALFAFIAAGTGPAFAQERSVREIPYVTCNGAHWRASLAEDRFWHTPRAPGPGAEPHADAVIHYRTWDNSCWSARWDTSRRRFVHSPLGSGRAHPDTILNFLDWEGVHWTARRSGDEWIVRQQ